MVARICDGCGTEVKATPHTRIRVERQPESGRVTIIEGNFIIHECLRSQAGGAA